MGVVYIKMLVLYNASDTALEVELRWNTLQY